MTHTRVEVEVRHARGPVVWPTGELVFYSPGKKPWCELKAWQTSQYQRCLRWKLIFMTSVWGWLVSMWCTCAPRTTSAHVLHIIEHTAPIPRHVSKWIIILKQWNSKVQLLFLSISIYTALFNTFSYKLLCRFRWFSVYRWCILWPVTNQTLLCERMLH